MAINKIIMESAVQTIAGDAKALLEQAGIQQEYYVWLPDGSMTKKSIEPIVEKEISELCQKMIVFPNPSNGNMLVKYDIIDEDEVAEIRFTTQDGKLLNTFLLNENKGDLQINCNSCITGNYILTLYVKGKPECSKNIYIKR